MDPLNTGNAYRLVLVIAPERSGKTTRLKDWARRQTEERGTQVAWLALEGPDNHPELFMADLDQALRTILSPTFFQPDQVTYNFSPETMEQFEDQALEDALAERINALAQTPGKLVLVLDNYEAIFSPEVHQAVGTLLDYLPPQVLVIIASSCEPPLPLARLRVRRQLLEIKLEDLENFHS